MTDVQEQKPEHDADQKDILAKDDHQVTVWRVPKFDKQVVMTDVQEQKPEDYSKQH